MWALRKTKVERAIQFRKKGCSILLVHEYDLWDALEDSERGPFTISFGKKPIRRSVGE